MSKKVGKIMSNIPRHYINAMDELQQENNKLTNKIKELEKLVNELSIGSVVLSAYMMDIDDEATIVIADNIAGAMDKASKHGCDFYKMVYSKSLPVLH